MADDGGSAELPTGTVTFLFTDIVGSTPLWDSFPDAMGPALARHDEIVRAAIVGAGGHVISTSGDSFVAVFARAGLAVEAALCAQRALTAEVWAGGPVLRVRMGIHTGDAEERDGDYFGPPLNRAARIMAAANGGQIVLSALTAGLVSGVSEFEFHDLGLVLLKGVVEPVHVVGVAGDGHAWFDRPLLTAQVSRGNLPRLPDEMVGDLADLQRRIANLARARVVTLTGSGGVGKTRAAIEIGWLVVDEFVDGVWLVELGPIADSDLVVTGIASVLGVHPQAGMTVVDSIVDWCYGRRMLLVLDNCEHVLDPVAGLTAAIVAGCPTVTIVATSREPLGVDGEIVVRIPSLEESFGCELFVLRATAADSSFEPSDADREVIAVICRRLDGIPLAIELAAARIRSLTPTELLARLDDRFRLLRGGGRGGLERHRTLRATVAWSYQLMSSDEQLLFDRLSVFAGTFDLAAAEAICARDCLDDTDIVDLLGDLVDKSMVIAVRSAAWDPLSVAGISTPVRGGTPRRARRDRHAPRCSPGVLLCLGGTDRSSMEKPRPGERRHPVRRRLGQPGSGAQLVDLDRRHRCLDGARGNDGIFRDLPCPSRPSGMVQPHTGDGRVARCCPDENLQLRSVMGSRRRRPRDGNRGSEERVR